MILENKKILNSKFVIGFCISLFFLYYSLENFEFSKFKIAIQSAKFTPLFLASFLLMFVVFLRALRWKLLIKKNGNINSNILFKGQLIGYFGNNIFPLRAGELLRTFYISEKNNLTKSEVFGSIVLERIFDLLGLFFVFLLLLNSELFRLINDQFIYGVSILIIICLIGIFFSFYYNKNRFSKSIKNRFILVLEEILDGFSSLNKKNILPATVLTVFIWVIYIYEVHLVQSAFNLNFTIFQSTFILFVSSLAMILPGMPGHFGTFEGSVIYALSFFNLYGLNNIEDNFGFGFILHFVSYIPYTIFGLFYFIEEYKFFITNKKKE